MVRCTHFPLSHSCSSSKCLCSAPHYLPVRVSAGGSAFKRTPGTFAHGGKKGRSAFCCWVLDFCLLASKQTPPFLNRGPWNLVCARLEMHPTRAGGCQSSMLKENKNSWIAGKKFICSSFLPQRRPNRKNHFEAAKKTSGTATFNV